MVTVSNMKITLIIGLPGSGKTFLANELSGIIVDDITSIDQLPDSANKLIITDVNFCDANIIERAEEMLRKRYDDVEIKRIYFENDAVAARKNVEYRNDGRNVEGTIRRFEPIYQPPTDACVIWNQE